MKTLRLHIAILPFVILLLTGVEAYGLQPYQLNDDALAPAGMAHASVYKRFSLNWDQFKTDNGMAKAPSASAFQSSLLNRSSVSIDEFSFSPLQHLADDHSSGHFSFARLLLIKPFFKKYHLLPMVGSTAIGAP